MSLSMSLWLFICIDKCVPLGKYWSMEACVSSINSFLESSEFRPWTCVHAEEKFTGKQWLGILKANGFKHWRESLTCLGSIYSAYCAKKPKDRDSGKVVKGQTGPLRVVHSRKTEQGQKWCLSEVPTHILYIRTPVHLEDWAWERRQTDYISSNWFPNG